MRRVLHRIQVIEVAEELVEAVDGGQELIEVAQVVLAELPGGVAHRLERCGDGRRLRRHADRRAGLADGGQSGADRQLAGDEVRATRRAARFGVVVGETHALWRQLVEVRRPAGHHAPVISADVEHADVIAHDEDDVGLASLRWQCCRLWCLSLSGRCPCRGECEQRSAAQKHISAVDREIGLLSRLSDFLSLTHGLTSLAMCSVPALLAPYCRDRRT